jgi:hypothetical protein
MEDEQECWTVSTMTAKSMKSTFRRPRWLAKRCVWLVLKAEGAGQFDTGTCMVSCTVPEGDELGVGINPQKEIKRLGDFILIPLCIEKDASPGNWTVRLETVKDTAKQIIDAGIEIK